MKIKQNRQRDKKKKEKRGRAKERREKRRQDGSLSAPFFIPITRGRTKSLQLCTKIFPIKEIHRNVARQALHTIIVSRWWSAATIAVVTGANRGIWFEIAHQLAMHGLSLTVILTSRDAAVSNEAAKVFQEGGLNVLVHQLDIVDLSSVKVFTEWLRQHYGGADILALEWVKSKVGIKSKFIRTACSWL